MSPMLPATGAQPLDPAHRVHPRGPQGPRRPPSPPPPPQPGSPDPFQARKIQVNTRALSGPPLPAPFREWPRAQSLRRALPRKPKTPPRCPQLGPKPPNPPPILPRFPPPIGLGWGARRKRPRRPLPPPQSTRMGGVRRNHLFFFAQPGLAGAGPPLPPFPEREAKGGVAPGRARIPPIRKTPRPRWAPAESNRKKTLQYFAPAKSSRAFTPPHPRQRKKSGRIPSGLIRPHYPLPPWGGRT